MNINVSSERDYSINCKGMAFFPTNFMLQTPPPPPHEEDHAPHHHPHPSISWFPQDYHQGTASTTTLLGKRSPMSFMGIEPCEQHHHQEQPCNTGGDDELSSEDIDGSSPQVKLLGEKKKRLSIEQVRTLDKSFELHGNKLEPERKLQLARAIGLQPRQVAIWFQNRRARWKTKQLEKEYDVLKRHFDAIKADNDALQSQNRKLHAEILALKGRDHPSHELLINLNKETEGSGSNRSSENSSDLKLNFSSIRTPPSSITDQREQDPPPHHPIPMSRQLFPVPSGLTNMFPNNIDDQSGFWPWLDQHQQLNN